MTKEERLSFLDRAKEVERALPDGAEILAISINSQYIQVYGNFNFRQFAEAYGAEVQNTSLTNDDGNGYIEQHAELFGCSVDYLLRKNAPSYEQELQRCGTL